MGNRPGNINRPNAIATMRKNGSAVVTQSKMIIPFYKFFRRGNASPSIQPLRGWLTRG